MFIQILIDNPNSWIVPYGAQLITALEKGDHRCVLLHDHREVIGGDILCLLSCEKIFKKLHLNKNNLVVHESDLPYGKGWSPLTWQILEGKNEIYVSLIEADEEVDSGKIYLKKIMKFQGHELLSELRHIQGIATIDIIMEFIENRKKITGIEQSEESSFFPKRQPEDSELDVNKSIKAQFNLLRVCDNERYPAFFEINGNKYIINIEKDD